jgi:hypothetical protein
MIMHASRISGVVFFLGWLIAGVAFAADPSIPSPLPNHPGNIFLAGEEVAIEIPNAAENEAWQVVDYDGKAVAAGHGGGKIALGRLPVGYYEVQRPAADGKKSTDDKKTDDKKTDDKASDDKNADIKKTTVTTVGVLAKLKSPTPANTPIACDIATAWFYPKPESMKISANLCTLAGLKWVRDRLIWQEIEPQRDTFSKTTRYDESAAIQDAAGLKVLQVNHGTPDWAGDDHKRFPADLRDAYHFYREIAHRWEGKVSALEPWNEADIDGFGGHIGSEIASLQKASYLGIKAGNPQMLVCQNVFALHGDAILQDFHANQAWPYFETFNLHHYSPLNEYPKIYADFRAVSAGRPLWVSECNIPVMWSGDRNAAEPTEADLKIQAQRVAQIYATSLYEGSAVVYYFILGHYVEGRKQFGIVHNDFTPRPAFVSLAAVGRLMAAAQPIGKLKTSAGVSGFLFHAKPDGEDRVVLVAWTQEGDATCEVPMKPLKVYDDLGREQAISESGGTSLALSPSPLFVVLPKDVLSKDKDTAAKFEVEPPPAAAPRLEGEPSQIVLQSTWPKKDVALYLSAYTASREEDQRAPVFVYNFGSKAVDGRLTWKGPEDWKIHLPQSIHVEPNGREEIVLEMRMPESVPMKKVETIGVECDCGEAGKAVLSLRFVPKPPKKPE